MKKKMMIMGLMVALGIGQVRSDQWEVTAKCVVFGNQSQTDVWDCLGGLTPPNCSSAMPPSGLKLCGLWKCKFVDNWLGVNCPPDPKPIPYSFWLNDGHGGQYQAQNWLATPVGICGSGYFSQTRVVLVPPMCAGPIGATMSIAAFDAIWNDPKVPMVTVERTYTPEETARLLEKQP